jgi:ABC-type sulfate transport system substrate-binding protein
MAGMLIEYHHISHKYAEITLASSTHQVKPNWNEHLLVLPTVVDTGSRRAVTTLIERYNLGIIILITTYYQELYFYNARRKEL